jgi:acyl dehydratase
VTAKLHFEDFAPGQVREFGPRVISREEIVAFAAEFDPQPMHLDEEAARATMLGGLGASGWHTCGILMRMMCDCFLLESASMGANAIDEVRWLKPVRPGDALTFRATVMDVKAPKSRPDLGFIDMLLEMRNAADEAVMTIRSSLMMGRREGAAP